jgi:tetratricopeptide (TPR) repeat protein
VPSPSPSLPSTPDQPADRAVEHARNLIDLQRWAQAGEALAPALADPGAGAEPWCLLARCQLSLDRPAEAVVSAARAAALEPEQEWPHRLQAVAWLHRNRPKRAREHAARALALAPESPETLYLMAQVHLACSQWADAAECARRNLAANPEASMSWESAAMVDLHGADWAGAERNARAGLALAPQDADLIMILGQSLERQGRADAAGQAYAAATRADPSDQRGRRALGRLGIPLLGGGVLLAVKLGFVLSANGLRMSLGQHWLGFRTVLAVVALALAVPYAVLEFRHRRATAQLTPELRDTARRQRRQDARGWLLVAAVGAGLLGLVAVLLPDPPAAGALAVVAVGALAWRRVWRRGVPPGPGAGAGGRWRLVQSIRRALR